MNTFTSASVKTGRVRRCVKIDQLPGGGGQAQTVLEPLSLERIGGHSVGLRFTVDGEYLDWSTTVIVIALITGKMKIVEVVIDTDSRKWKTPIMIAQHWPKPVTACAVAINAKVRIDEFVIVLAHHVVVVVGAAVIVVTESEDEIRVPGLDHFGHSH